MALWKITVKRGINKTGLRFDVGMSVELSTPCVTNPLTTNSSKHIPQIRQLFESKYGIDLEHYVNSGYLESERIS